MMSASGTAVPQSAARQSRVRAVRRILQLCRILFRLGLDDGRRDLLSKDRIIAWR